LAAATAPAKRRRTEVAALARIDDTSSWPADVALRVTAVDAGSGEFVTFDRDSGVRLLDAVSASCAVPGVWAPVRIGDRYYVDGAVRSPVNASLGSAAPVALILAPLGEPRAITRELRRYAPDALVEVVTADAQAVRAFGPNPLNPAVSAAAAEAGLRQGRGLGDLAGRLRDRLARLGADRVNTG
jgi:NTE family protein